jgi:hypothetical protein
MNSYKLIKKVKSNFSFLTKFFNKNYYLKEKENEKEKKIFNKKEFLKELEDERNKYD